MSTAYTQLSRFLASDDVDPVVAGPDLEGHWVNDKHAERTFSMSIPIARVVAVEPYGKGRAVSLTVRCPYCNREHHHGCSEPREDGDYGHRVAHCGTRFDRHDRQLPPWPGQSQGYYIRAERN